MYFRKKRFRCVVCLSLAFCLTLGMAPGISAAGETDFPFQDVPDSHWANDAIRYVFQRGLMQGTSPLTFAPGGTVSHAMAATVLYRLAGQPPTEFRPVFDDVSAGQWYSEAVVWAYDNQIVLGVGHDRFAPDDPVTREALATMFYRYAENVEDADIDTAVPSDFTLGRFTDHSKVSGWAEDAVRWAVYTGRISGRTNTTLVPRDTTTRAECAAILMRPDSDYEFDANTGTIVKYIGKGGDVVIPSEIGRVTVRAIGNSAFRPERDNSFSGGGRLLVKTTSVFIPDSVTSIGDSAFADCEELISISIPNSVVQLGESVFQTCRKLTKVDLPAGIGSIKRNTFQGCIYLENMTIPDNITSIGIGAFAGCSRLKSVKLPTNLVAIGGAAFAGCESLSDIEIPAGVTAIGEAAFNSCVSLSDIRVDGKNTAYISVGGVLYTKDMTKLLQYPALKAGERYVIPNGVVSIGASAFFHNKNIKSVSIPNSVVSIGASAFDGCGSLSSVNLPDGITVIEGCTFRSCYQLKDIAVPHGVTSIGEWAFCNTGLVNVTLPNSVTVIKMHAFDGCYSLTSVALPNGLTSIGKQAFVKCNKISRLVLPGSLTEIGSFALPFTLPVNNIPIYVPNEAIKSLIPEKERSSYNIIVGTPPD